jgi:hypothetical protein
MRENYLKGIGMFDVRYKAYDSCDPTTARTIATNYVVKLYKNHGGTWIPGPTLDADGEYFDLKPEDNGYCWAVVTIPSGQAFYVDYVKIKAEDPYISSYIYTDVDGDGTKDFAFQYDMRNHAIPASGYPIIAMQGYILTYDASFTGLNDLANATAIGQTTTTKYYNYYLAFSAAKKGVAIYKVEVRAVTTDETKVRLRKLEIPGIGNLDGSSFERIVTATDIRWTYTLTYNFDNALYLKRMAQDNNEYDMTLQLEYTLANSDDIQIGLYVYYLTAQTEAGATASDTFYAQE